MRRWLRRVPPDHLHWLTTQANSRLIAIATEVFSSIKYCGDPLRHALTVLAATAIHEQQRFGFPDPLWALSGCTPAADSSARPQPLTSAAHQSSACPSAPSPYRSHRQCDEHAVTIPTTDPNPPGNPSAFTVTPWSAVSATGNNVYARKVVGWKVASEMTRQLVIDAINHAVDVRKRSGTIDLKGLIHSDAGSQGGFNRSSQHLD